MPAHQRSSKTDAETFWSKNGVVTKTISPLHSPGAPERDAWISKEGKSFSEFLAAGVAECVQFARGESPFGIQPNAGRL